MITEDKIHGISNIQSLLAFMSEELDWELPSPAAVDELTFEWTGTELNLSEDVARKLRSGSIKQIQPLRKGQPWGIFLVDFATPRLYATALRQVLRRLVPSRRTQKPNIPAWQCENLLFICTIGNQEFTFAHFSGEKPERARITTFGWTPQEPVRTLCEFNLPALRYDYTWDDEKWLKEWQRAFDVEKVTKRFFNDYTKVFVELQRILYKQVRGEAGDDAAKVWAHDYALQFLNRLMFIYFIQKKRWLGENPRFTRHFWQAYRDTKQPADTFFKNWLSVLFFEAFNNQYQNRAEYLNRFPEDVHQALSRAPFLNGGLFSRNRLDTQHTFNVPDDFFELLFEEFEDGPGFFERYNFTISETTPLDQEVAVDPEMIGKVYESLVNITFEGISEEDLRGGAGIFYTPRVEIDMMCRLSLVDWLTNHLGGEYKSALYQAVFAYDPKEKEEADSRLANENLWSRLDKLLRSITVLDPACGSGSFLIGMLLVLDDLLARAESQLGRKQTQFVRRKDVLANSLYGVDVMPWAVHVAELRLWLQLVVETEHQWYELKAEPMLPNLSFKLRPGDSLVQEVGGINFGLHRAHQDIPSSLKGKLTQLKGEKLKFYRNDPQAKFKTEEALRHEELNVFREILEYRAQKLENDIKSLTQRIETPQAQAVMPGMGPKAVQAPLVVQQWREERSRLEEELQEVRAARETLRTIQDVPFVWDIAFVEIFRGEKEGFDIVIGNPPYVRQENIEDPQEVYDKATYKARLQQSVYAAYPAFFGYNAARNTLARKIDGRSDYYVFFYLHGLKLLNEKGSFCFITSNSWLDVGYGRDLQEFLLKHCHIKMVLDNERKRSFAQADINTVIVLFSAPNDRSQWGLDKQARFIMFRVPFEYILSPVIFDEIEEAGKTATGSAQRQPKVAVFGADEMLTLTELSRPEFRARVISQGDLYKDGLILDGSASSFISEKEGYGGGKWGGKYLRAPEIFWTIMARSKGKLARLKDIATVLTVSWSRQGQNARLMRDKISGEARPPRLIDVLKSPRDVSKIILTNSDTRCFLKLEGWVKDQLTYAPILWVDIRGDKHVCHRCLENIAFTHNFHGIQPNNSKLTDVLCGILNSQLIWLFIEVLGRRGLGGGAVRVLVEDLKFQFPVFNPSTLNAQQKDNLERAFGEIAERDVGNVFEELGLPQPNRDFSNINSGDISLDKVLPDRRELDKVVFEALGLTEEEQLEVYRAVVELVKNRLAKAGSV